MKQVLLWMIRFYQTNISPLRPPCCRFIPTCSQSALAAVERYCVRRMRRCHPFQRQKSVQYDPVP